MEKIERITEFLSKKNKKIKPPWHWWQQLSEKGEARDSLQSDCGHQFFIIPYTVEFLVSSKISLQELVCHAPVCKAVDQYYVETDITYISKIDPPSVKPVNRNAALVMSRDGIIQGPYTFQEWKEYSWQYWDWFHDIIHDPFGYTKDNASTWWSKVYFRATTDFIAGNYNYYKDIQMLMIREIVDRDAKHSAYENMHRGVDLYHNLIPVDVTEAKPFYNNGKVFNFSVPHVTNHQIRGKKIQDTNIIQERFSRRKFFEELKMKKKLGSDLLAKARPDDHSEVLEKQYFRDWYPLIKQIPLRSIENKNVHTVLPAVFGNNDVHIENHWNKVIKCLTGFLTTGALKIMPESYEPIMSAALVLANADHPTKKVRPCFDGGPLKLTEAFKFPCKLEGLPHIFSLLMLMDKVTKLDDTQGFHLVALHPESRDLCTFRFAGRDWQYLAIPFGASEAPGAFQQANQVPLLYARRLGLMVTCYLDDRLISEPAEFVLKGVKINPNLGRSTFLIVLLILASGGFINMLKSNFTPVFTDEFLGMDIDTTTCTVSVPERKWVDLQNRLTHFQNLQEISMTDLEQIRGIMTSLLIATKNLKMFIRVQTRMIEACNRKHKGEIHHFFKRDMIKITSELRQEWAEWQKATILETSRCWLPPIESGTPVYFLHTDASLAQWGAVLFKGEVEVGEIALPFSEYQSDWTIVQKEILAILLALVHFSEIIRGSQIQLFCDNQQAVYAFLNEGSREPRVNEILIDIHRIIKLMGAELKIAWIPTHLQIGDEPSRVIDLNEEFLPVPYFNVVQSIVPFTLEVDVMASLANHKCPLFITRGNLRVPVEGKLSTDFLNTDPNLLEGKNLYVFPPKVALEKVARLLATKYSNTNFALVFLQFSELPLGIERLIALGNTTITTLTTNKAFSFIPSETSQILNVPGCKRDYMFKGSPNIRPKSVRLLIHRKTEEQKEFS